MPAVPGNENSKHRNSEKQVSPPAYRNAALDLGALKHPSARQRPLAVPQNLESTPCEEKRDQKERSQGTENHAAPPWKLIAKRKRTNMTKERGLQPEPVQDGEHDAYHQEHDQTASPLRCWLNEFIGHAHPTVNWTTP